MIEIICGCISGVKIILILAGDAVITVVLPLIIVGG
jgi:hypothetical protein